MREILFRGKRVRNGEWIYGSPIAMDSDISSSQVFIFPPYKGASSLPCSFLVSNNMEEVDPKTIGQYTGLADKNGKKIFEGDVVQAYFRNNHSKQIFQVVFDDGMFLFDNGCVKVPKYDIYAMEVIGNIHDNPELLGGADNGE